MKDMFEKDHFRFLFLALVLVSVAMLVPCMRVSAAQTEQHFAVHYWGLGNNPLSEESVYDVRVIGESPVYIFAYHYSGEYSFLEYAYYAISKSAFTVSSDSPRMSNLVVGKLKKNGDEYSDSTNAVGEIQLYYSRLDSGINGRFSDNYVSMEFDSFNSSSDSLLFLISVNDYLNGDYTGWDFSHSDTNLSHSQEFGVLAGLEIKRLFVPAKVDSSLITNPDLLPSEVAYQIEFDSRTTTGYLLKGINNDWIPPTATSEGNGSPQTVVRVWAKACYYLDKNDTLLWESADVGIGSYDPSDLSFRIEDKKIALALKEVANYPSDDGLTPLDVYRSDSLYFQIYDKYKGYGDVLRVRHFRLSPKNNQQADIIDDIGNIVTGSSVTIKDGTSSIGGDFDEALDHVDSGYSWVIDGNFDFDITDYFNNMGAFFDQIQIFPSIIAKILSFLPKWVLDMIALSIGSMCVILVIKAWRG